MTGVLDIAPTLASTVPGLMAFIDCGIGCRLGIAGGTAPVAGIPAGMTGAPPTLPSTVPGIWAFMPCIEFCGGIACMAEGAREVPHGFVVDGCAAPVGESLAIIRDPQRSRAHPGLVAAQCRRDVPSRGGHAM
jgi:hypothetical protein